VQPAVVAQSPRRPRLHEILRFEMRARRIRRAGRFDNRQLTAVPQRLQRLERRVQAESSIEVDRAAVLAGRRHGNRGPQLVIALLEERDDDVQPVRGAALEHRDENLPLRALLRGGAEQPRWRGADPREGNSGRTKKTAPRAHDYLLWKSGDPRTSATSIE